MLPCASAFSGLAMLLLFMVILLCIFEAPALAIPENISGANEAGMKQQRFSIMHDGVERTYFVHLPESYKEGTAAPLLILLHGGGGLARRMLAFTGFGPIAEKHGIVVVAPSGIERHWNDGRVKTGYKAHDEKIDDVAFIAALIKKIETEHSIDPNRIYATGISNGAMMSYRLGLELSEKIAAIAPVVGSLPDAFGAKTQGAAIVKASHPVPAIIFNGTDDPLVPFKGGEVHFYRKKLGTVLSVADTAQFWAARNGCESKPKVSSVPVSDPDMKVVKTTFSGCANGADVVLYAIEGAGHTWPGPEPGAQYLPARLIGRACHGLNATELIWEFFEKHARVPAKEPVKKN